MSELSFRRAVAGDLPQLLALQAAYYAEDTYPFDAAGAREAWSALLQDPGLGEAWVAPAPEGLVAYVVLTLGFSLEYRGLDAFVDELYVAPAWRGRGLGRRALDVVEAACAERGVKALHLEVEKDKPGALALYRQRGFVDHDRFLMTRTGPGKRRAP
jgi:GNAT superfamily N-acetyltransferase